MIEQTETTHEQTQSMYKRIPIFIFVRLGFGCLFIEQRKQTLIEHLHSNDTQNEIEVSELTKKYRKLVTPTHNLF